MLSVPVMLTKVMAVIFGLDQFERTTFESAYRLLRSSFFLCCAAIVKKVETWERWTTLTPRNAIPNRVVSPDTQVTVSAFSTSFVLPDN